MCSPCSSRIRRDPSIVRSNRTSPISFRDQSPNMIEDIAMIFKNLDTKDFRTLTGIEIGMKFHEWVPLDELPKFARLPIKEIQYRLFRLTKNDLVIRKTQPYEGYKIYFNGYDALAMNTLVKRKVINAIGNRIGVGKESVVYEAKCHNNPFVIKFHREGRTFKQVKRKRTHLKNKEHFSWIYAARLAAKREYNALKTLYPKVSVPKPLNQNRHAVVMNLACGSELSKTKVSDPDWFLEEIIQQINIAYSLGIIHADLSEYNIFVNPDGIEIIDWPQYVTIDQPHSKELLERDIENILTFFKRKYNIKKDLKKIVDYFT